MLFELPTDCLRRILQSDYLTLLHGELELVAFISTWHVRRVEALQSDGLSLGQAVDTFNEQEKVCSALLHDCVRFPLLDMTLMQTWIEAVQCGNLTNQTISTSPLAELSNHVLEGSVEQVQSALVERRGIDEVAAAKRWGRHVSFCHSVQKCYALFDAMHHHIS
ncbi:unnamed protein product [Protopolystoma xenopodis]|uniref:Uncharacterized protein n=1 Tax=Protopolystoma xenopodis TaxID=117903 RepID=A0A448WV00_9PLAT|nr:unnamed protein product [Protopolystoma xenopodis]